MKTYTYNDSEYYFDNLALIALIKDKSPQIMYACQRLCEKMNDIGIQEYGDIMCNNLHTVYSWVYEKNGKYTSPNNIEVVKCLAKALGVDTITLLRKDAYSAIEHINRKSIEDYDNMNAEEILTKVIMSYSATNGYFYVSKYDDEDGMEYWLKMVDMAREKIRMSGENRDIVNERLLLCDEITSFIKSYEYADGLSELIFEENPYLKFFTTPYELMDESMETFVRAKLNYLFIPSVQEIIERSKYFEKRKSENPQFDDETIFMYELATTVRSIYYNGFRNKKETSRK